MAASAYTSVSTARHNLQLGMYSAGIFLAETIFGVSILNSEGRAVPVRYLGEQHVREDLGRIPTLQDWLVNLRPAPWMFGQKLELEKEAAGEQGENR